MDVAVLGAGPAGCFFGAYVKQQIPESNVTVYERGPRVATQGYGYVLGFPVMQQLALIDPSVEFLALTTDPWDTGETYVHNELIGNKMLESVGVRRNKLVNYMRRVAERSGANMEYDCDQSLHDLERVRKDVDVFVAADGLHSVIRDVYSDAIGATVALGRQSHAWLFAKTDCELLRATAFEYDDDVLVAHSYPVDNEISVLVIEGRKNEHHNLHGSEASRWCEGLSSAMTRPFGRFEVEPQEVNWNQTMVNGAQRIVQNNVAFIGDAGVSVYYTMGNGLLCAFTAGYGLVQSLMKKDTIKSALEAYQEGTIHGLLDSHRSSVGAMTWLAQVDSAFHELDRETFMHQFRNKDFTMPH